MSTRIGKDSIRTTLKERLWPRDITFLLALVALLLFILQYVTHVKPYIYWTRFWVSSSRLGVLGLAFFLSYLRRGFIAVALQDPLLVVLLFEFDQGLSQLFNGSKGVHP